MFEKNNNDNIKNILLLKNVNNSRPYSHINLNF